VTAAAEPGGAGGSSGRAPESVIAFGGAPGDPPKTWLDLIAAADQVRASLVERGWQRPLVFCGDRFAFLACLLAAWESSGLPILPANGRPETLRALVDAGAADGLVHDGVVQGTPGLEVSPACVDAGAAGADALARAARLFARRDHDPLLALYSSGSTGAPSASIKTAAQLFGEADTLARTFDLGARTRLLATAPPHHIYGLLAGVLAPLYAGGAFLRQTPLHAPAIARLVAEHGVDVLCAVPPHLHGLQVLAPGSIAGVTRVFSSGARLPPETAEFMRQRFGLGVTELLGSSETGGIAWRLATDGADWTPLPGVEVSADLDGTLLLDSPFAARHEPRPRRCADRIEMTAGARFRHLGRADAIVKIAGERVSLPEVEQRLLALDGVRDAAVLALDDAGPRQHEICAAVVAPGLSVADLRQALAGWFDPVAIPRRFALVDRLPREETGKLPRSRLEALFASERQDREGGPR
jgi:acyl-coenzyme A synthetase/AMP-(fatty) acid ligase